MHFLKNDADEFIIVWNARCACTSIKNWFYFYKKKNEFGHKITAETVEFNGHVFVLPSLQIHTVLPYNTGVHGILNHPGYKTYKRIIAVRNPYDRFLSVLTHPSVNVHGIYKDTLEETADALLDKIEQYGHTLDHHFEKQSYMADADRSITKEELEQFNIVYCEDNVIQSINDLLGYKSHIEYRLNANSPKFELNEDQKIRIKNIYEEDFKLFYPDL